MTRSKSESAVKSAVLVSAIIVFVKLLGFIKQAVIAFYLGASTKTDAFFLANTVINGIAQAVFSAVSVSMIPMYLSKKEKSGKDGTDAFANSVMSVFGSFALILTFSFVIFSPIFARVFGMNLNGEENKYLAMCFRQEALICFCYGVIAIMGAILEAEKKFIPLRLNGIFLSLTIMISLFVDRNRSASTLIYAVVISNTIEVIYMYLCVRKFFKLGIKKIDFSSTKPLLKLTLPLLLGNAIIQINSMIDKVIATNISEGGVTCLNYGQVLYDFVNATLIVSLSSVAFSYFASAVAKGNRDKLMRYLRKSLSYLIIALLPVSAYSIVESRDIVTLIYGRGAFSAQNIHDCTQALLGYSVGFVFIAVREIVVKAHYAFQDTKRPMMNGLVAVFANIILSISLSRFFGLFGITIATSIAAVISMLLSSRTLKIHIDSEKIWDWPFVLKMAISAAFICPIGYLLMNLLKGISIIPRMFMVFVAVFSLYGLLLYILKVHEIYEIKTRCVSFLRSRKRRQEESNENG